MADLNIAGTVIQRSFMPRGLNTVINIATAPLDELLPHGPHDGDSVRRLTADILGIPRNLPIDEVQYGRLGRILASKEYSERLMDEALDPFTYEFIARPWRDMSRDIIRRMEGKESPRQVFAEDLLALLTSPDAISGIGPFPFYPWNYPYGGRKGNRPIRDFPQIAELNLPTEALQTGFACIFAGLDPEPRVRDFIRSLNDYEIPFGQSPEVVGNSLLQMIEGGQKLCLAPLVGSSAIAMGHLQQNSIVAALQTVGTGAAMTLMLIGTLSVGDYLVRYVMHKRREFEDASESAESKERDKQLDIDENDKRKLKDKDR